VSAQPNAGVAEGAFMVSARSADGDPPVVGAIRIGRITRCASKSNQAARLTTRLIARQRF